jgi:hypothetical protein
LFGFPLSFTPENFYKFIPAILSSLSFLLAMMSTSWCEFVKVQWVASDGESISQSFGLWTYETYTTSTMDENVYQTCVKYGYNPNSPLPFEHDSKWRSAMAFSVIGGVIGGLVCLQIWLIPCCYHANALFSGWKCMGFSCFFVSLFQGLTLLFLAGPVCNGSETTYNGLSVSSTGCSRQWGANCSIALVLLWFFAGIATLAIPPPNCRKEQIPETHTVTYTQTTMPDGTRVVNEQTTVVRGVAVPKPGVPEATAVAVIHHVDFLVTLKIIQKKLKKTKKQIPIAEQPHTRCFRKFWRQIFIDDCN